MNRLELEGKDYGIYTPKNANKVKVEWRVSEKTKAIVKYYAEYTGYTEDEVVDEFIKVNILNDSNFLKWIYNKRRNKRILSLIGLGSQFGNKNEQS